MRITVGLDAAWGGLGWSLATDQGPLAVGHVKLNGSTWRWQALSAYLDEVIAPTISDGELMLGADDPAVRLVIEEPPMVYSGAARAKKTAPGEKLGMAGNQAAVGYGLGRLAGALELWSFRRGGLAYPWLVDPRTWRAWWRVGGKGRAERKQAAVGIVRASGWARHLEPHKWTGDDGGAQGDVAEAMLLAVGAARRHAEAPAGPTRPHRGYKR
jgi:hypothetical protein